MSEYITQIPNLEKGKVYTINVSAPESAVNAVKELVYRLCVTYGTSVDTVSRSVSEPVPRTDIVGELLGNSFITPILGLPRVHRQSSLRNSGNPHDG